MHRLTLRFTSALITFLIGVALVSAWLISRHHSATTNPGGDAPAVPSSAEEKRTYKSLDHASVLLRDGGYAACISTVESSGGVRFTSIIAVLPSDKKAQSEMDKILQRASELIKRESVFDEKGKRIGEKAVATFSGRAEPLVGSAQLLWTRGAEFNRVGSSSLQSVLEYEKDYDW
jgi:hypothetical protein